MRRGRAVKRQIMGWILPAIGAVSALSRLIGNGKGELEPGQKTSVQSPWIEAGANIIGGVANNLLARSNQKAMNAYNDPKQQIRRIVKAGLPYAAYEDGKAGNQQSATPVADLGIGSAGKAIGDRYLRTGQAQQNDLMMQTIALARQQAEQGQMFLDFLKKQNDSGATNAWTGFQADLDKRQADAELAAREASNKATEGIILKAQARNAEAMSDNALETARATLGNILKTGEKLDAEIEGILTDNVIKAVIAEWQPEMSEAEYKKILQDTATGASQEALNKAAKALTDQNREIGAANFPVENLTKWANLNAQEIGNRYNLSNTQIQEIENEMLKAAQEGFIDGMSLESAVGILRYGSYMAMKAAADRGELSATKMGKEAGTFLITRGKGLK